MNKPTGDEPPSQQIDLPFDAHTPRLSIDELKRLEVFNALDGKTQTLVMRTFETSRRRAEERAYREATREAEIVALKAELMRAKAEKAALEEENQRLRRSVDSLQEEVVHHRFAVGFYEEENAQLREELDMPRNRTRLDYN